MNNTLLTQNRTHLEIVFKISGNISANLIFDILNPVDFLRGLISE